MRIPALALAACVLSLTAAPAPIAAQTPAPGAAPAAARKTGPIVPSFGGVSEVPDAVLMPPKD